MQKDKHSILPSNDDIYSNRYGSFLPSYLGNHLSETAAPLVLSTSQAISPCKRSRQMWKKQLVLLPFPCNLDFTLQMSSIYNLEVS